MNKAKDIVYKYNREEDFLIGYIKGSFAFVLSKEYDLFCQKNLKIENGLNNKGYFLVNFDYYKKTDGISVLPEEKNLVRISVEVPLDKLKFIDVEGLSL